MNRSLGAALFIAGLAFSVSGTAEAKSHPGTAIVAAAQPAEQIPTIASNMPSANADLVMWSSAAPAPHKGGVEKKQADAMHRFARGIISRTSSIARSLTRNAMRFIGTPYVFGGTSASGFDCSGYVQHVFAMLGVALPRTADAQFYAGRRASGGVLSGDLVFFQTYEPGPSHVGIYLGAGKFIHSSSHGVMVSRLSDRYWANRYLGAKRVVANR